MILNVSTVISFFLAGIGLVLALAAVIVAAWSWRAWRRASERAGKQAIEDRVHLLALIVGVLGCVRLLAWPHFYLLLKSYVDDLAVFGVMCVFGVTRIHPELVLLLQTIKPILLLSIGLWWLLGFVDRKTKATAFLGVRLVGAIPLAALAMVDCLAEIAYLIREKVGQRVTCCTQFLDTAAATTGVGTGPFETIGLDSSWATFGVYVLLHAVVIVAALYLRRRAAAVEGSIGLLAPAVVMAVGLASLAATRWVWIDIVAPIVLQLPYHHCIYELLTDTTALGLAAILAIAGHGCLVWPLLLQAWRGHAKSAISALQSSIYGLCAVAVLSEVLIVGIHVL